MTYTNGGCRIVFDVDYAVTGFVSIALTARDQPIRAKDLSATKLDLIRDETYRVAGTIVPDSEGGHDAAPRLVRKTLVAGTLRRRSP